MATPLLVFVPELTPRISYTFALFFESLLPTGYKFTSDSAEYKAYSGPKLNYSNQAIENDKLFIPASGQLSENKIKPQNITVTEWQGIKVFYQVAGGALPFDLFAAAFYLVSRYEEYLSNTYDEHGRFKHTESLAFKSNFLDVPVINLWAEELRKIILKHYPEVEIAERKYTYVPSLDIDVAYAHLGRSAGVTIGARLKLLAKFDFPGLAHKRAVLQGKQKDEYDTYEYQEAFFRQNNIKPLYFILAGERSAYDKNIDTGSAQFATLIKKLSSFGSIGIHPSYQSASIPERVGEEIKRVEKHLPGKIKNSRQHFLKVSLPETYRCLADLNVTDDYSMAYAAVPGFRAGICTPFWFYDLPAEKALPVKLHSTVAMDGTFNEYLRISPDEAIDRLKKLIQQVKKCRGEFISIWHNHSLNEQGNWKGWRRVFETMIKESA